jgi:integrase
VSADLSFAAVHLSGLDAVTVQNQRAVHGPSTIVNRTVTPRRPRNADLREREYLTPKEVDRLQDAARKHSRYGHRDATAILIAYRHGLRASELAAFMCGGPKTVSIARTHSPARKFGPCALQ